MKPKCYRVNVKKGTVTYKGLTLDLSDMYQITYLYERIMTAQYLAENDRPSDYDDAMEKACKVRNLMADNPGMTEEEAIEEIERREAE